MITLLCNFNVKIFRLGPFDKMGEVDRKKALQNYLITSHFQWPVSVFLPIFNELISTRDREFRKLNVIYSSLPGAFCSSPKRSRVQF